MISTNQYQVIYADPPWSYQDKRTTGKNKAGGAENHYNTMSIEDIKQLPVKDISADTCLLFMWATFPLMPIWNEVMISWGFEYKTLGFNWIKTYPKSGKICLGVGSYTRSNSEVCLIGIKGKGSSLIKDHTISNQVIAPRERHSAKPQVFRDLIVQMVGDVPKIELFARQTSPGWDVWGNEI